MTKQSIQNKKAWEHNAYDFWVKKYGEPSKLAEAISKNPSAYLKKHQAHFRQVEGKSIANICGSNGRKAVPLALMGAKVSVFDISNENKMYALELADFAGVSIDYIVTDVLEIDRQLYSNSFEILYLEGGILHYFSDINKLTSILSDLLIPGGTLVLSDFHPIKRCLTEIPGETHYRMEPAYFDQPLHTGEVAFKKFFAPSQSEDFPEVLVKPHTLSEILNAVIQSGLTIRQFEEHPGWNGENIPWEYTLIAEK
ncbi:methyltransferase domain-containing protein [Bacillus salacetis]|uniref:Methyltransferase domain-containing protein n=1 Tax=Bacillus salacetis TaxID=2315464 RepID=A0A3A1R338_9BACI|nr:methyltransferase domain-containing protein [Bacillus salacetis]RIW34654.1 methyltransferase domain-containing protein [Bacillus salacetis]